MRPPVTEHLSVRPSEPYSEAASLFINGLLAIIGFFALWVYNGQLEVMRRQLDEMKRSGQETTNQANQVIGNINWLARETMGAVAQAQEAAKKNERNAKAALDATITQNRNDQRAWIIVDEVRLVMLQSGKQLAGRGADEGCR